MFGEIGHADFRGVERDCLQGHRNVVRVAVADRHCRCGSAERLGGQGNSREQDGEVTYRCRS